MYLCYLHSKIYRSEKCIKCLPSTVVDYKKIIKLKKKDFKKIKGVDFNFDQK